MAGSGGSTQDPHAARIAVLGSGQDEQVRALQDVARVSDLPLQAQPLARASRSRRSFGSHDPSPGVWVPRRVDSCQRWEALDRCGVWQESMYIPDGVDHPLCVGSASGEQRIFC